MFDDKTEEITNNPFSDESASDVDEKLIDETQPAEESLTNLQNELADLNNKYLRLMADFDNYRKRQAQERENLLKYGAAETLKKIIVVLDTIERANKSIDEIEDPKTIRDSYDIVFKHLFETLEKCGLEKIETDNKEFDPTLHEAVSQTPTPELPEHTIISTAQTGYKIGDLVLRPALVNVSVAVCERQCDSEE